MGASMGGGKGPNVDLNLVPFIDLLTTLICFLLFTAVWQEYNSMQSNAPPKSTAEMPEDPQPTPPLDQPKKVMLTVALGTDKIEVAEDDKHQPIPHLAGGEPDVTKLVAVLKDWKSRFPDKKDVVLATDNQAKYKHLVLMMDTLIAEQFSDVGVNLN